MRCSNSHALTSELQGVPMQSNSTQKFLFDLPPTKVCTDCKRNLSPDDFYLRPNKSFMRICKLCLNHRCKTWHHSTAGKKYRRKQRLKRAFGLSVQEYESMLIAQNGVCAICHKHETRNFNGRICPLAVDHDHATGKIRKLLCHNCNKGLGFFRDNPVLLLEAAKYLEENH